MRRRGLWISLGSGLLALWAAVVWADAHDTGAQHRIEATPCAGATIGAKLDEEARIHSRRDLGWRFFPGEGYMDAERAFRVSKGMEIRYRWRVDAAGKTEPQTDSARELCP